MGIHKADLQGQLPKPERFDALFVHLHKDKVLRGKIRIQRASQLKSKPMLFSSPYPSLSMMWRNVVMVSLK